MGGNHSEEIDLLDVAAKTYRAIRNNLVFVVGLPILGVAIGFLNVKSAPKHFESKMVVYSEILTYPVAGELIETLDELIHDDPALLSRKLGLSENQGSKIREISISPVGEVAPTFPIDIKYLRIKVLVDDQNLLDTLQGALLEYFEQNHFVKIRVDQRKAYYLQLIRDLDQELQSLETLKQNNYSGNFIERAKGNVMFDPTTVNSKIIALKEDRIIYSNNLELVNSVQIVEGLTENNHLVSEPRKFTMVSCGLIGLILAFLVIGSRALYDAIKNLNP